MADVSTTAPALQASAHVANSFTLDTFRERYTVGSIRNWRCHQLKILGQRHEVHFACMLLFLLAIVGIKPAQADSIGPLYDVSGTMAFTGNNDCTASPCSETLQFSFQFGYNYDADQNLYEGYALPGTISVTSLGVLGTSFSTNGHISPIGNVGPTCSGGDTNYMEFFNSAGTDEIDLHSCATYEPNPFVAPSFTWTDIYGCTSVDCANDFNSGHPFSGLFYSGTLQTNVVQVPEGGTVSEYCAISFLFIALAAWYSRRTRTAHAVLGDSSHV